MKQKIYFIFDQLPSNDTGGLVTMYRQLTLLLEDCFEIQVISAFESGYKSFEGHPVININKTNTDISLTHMKSLLKNHDLIQALHIPWSIFLYLTQRRSISKKIDKLLSTETSPIIIAASPAAACFLPSGIPFILEIHSTYDYFFNGKFISKSQIKMMKKPALTLFRSKKDAAQAPDSIHPSYIYNFVISPERQPNLNILSNKNKIIFMGRLEPEKNPLRLLDIAYLLKKSISDFRLDIYGSGSMYGEMVSKIEEYNLTDNVILKGYTQDKTVYKNYAMVWSTSLFEGFGLTIIEGKQYGLPTISINWGGCINEVIKDGVNGFIANSNHEMVERTMELMEDPVLLAKFSRNAFDDFSRFDSETAKSNWLNLIDRFNRHHFKGGRC